MLATISCSSKFVAPMVMVVFEAEAALVASTAAPAGGQKQRCGGHSTAAISGRRTDIGETSCCCRRGSVLGPSPGTMAARPLAIYY